MTPDGWTETKMKAAFTGRKEKGEAGLPILSVTLRDGLKRRDELSRKIGSDLAPEGHLRICKGDIAYNMMRMWQGAVGQAPPTALRVATVLPSRVRTRIPTPASGAPRQTKR